MVRFTANSVVYCIYQLQRGKKTTKKELYGFIKSLGTHVLINSICVVVGSFYLKVCSMPAGKIIPIFLIRTLLVPPSDRMSIDVKEHAGLSHESHVICLLRTRAGASH